MSTALLGVLLAAYGNPAIGLAAFAKKLEGGEADSEMKAGGDTFMQKIHRLRDADPETYEKYHLETATLTRRASPSPAPCIAFSLPRAWRVACTRSLLPTIC
jgi:hypothetical protein